MKSSRLYLLVVLSAVLALSACSTPPPASRSRAVVVRFAASPANQKALGVTHWHVTLLPDEHKCTIDGSNSKGQTTFAMAVRHGDDGDPKSAIFESYVQPGRLWINSAGVQEQSLPVSVQPFSAGFIHDLAIARVPYAGFWGNLITAGGIIIGTVGALVESPALIVVGGALAATVALLDAVDALPEGTKAQIDSAIKDAIDGVTGFVQDTAQAIKDAVSPTTPDPSMTPPDPSGTTPPDPSMTPPDPSQTPDPSGMTPQDIINQDFNALNSPMPDPSMTPPDPSGTTPPDPSGATPPDPSGATPPDPSAGTPDPSAGAPDPSAGNPDPSAGDPSASAGDPSSSSGDTSGAGDTASAGDYSSHRCRRNVCVSSSDCYCAQY